MKNFLLNVYIDESKASSKLVNLVEELQTKQGEITIVANKHNNEGIRLELIFPSSSLASVN